MDISLKQLRYTVAVADRLHFRKAAEVCFVTQPALSDQIHLLEEQLGGALFERSTKQVTITPLGEEIVRRARAILRDVDDLEHAAQKHKQPFSDPIVMGVIPTIAPYVLPKLLRYLRKAIPQLKLYLREEQTSVIMQKLRDGALDLVLLSFPIDSQGLELRDWYDEEFIFISPPGHRLQERTHVLQKHISGESILLLEEGHCLSDQALEICSMAGAVENKQFRASSLNTLVQMVANGLGVTLLPRLAVDVEVKGNPQLAYREFSGDSPTRRVGLAWRKQSPRYLEYEKIFKLFRKHTPQVVHVCG